MSSYINSIGIANPSFKHEQNDILSFMLNDVSAIEQQKKLKAAFRASGVSTRYSILPDFGISRKEKNFLNSSPKVEARMAKYRKEALPLAIDAIKNCFDGLNTIHQENISHIITVSCTGMYAPGLDIDIINTLNLRHNIGRACLNFMGCNAAINAMRMADAIVRSDNKAHVLILCVELCTLHYQPSSSDDFILSNTLFSDGAAAVIISNKHQESLFKINEFHSAIHSEGALDMCWNIHAKGFEMVLSSYVPELIRTGIDSLLKKNTLNQGKHFAIHPGGKKILDTLLQLLDKKEEDLEDSYAILKNYGNMSSPTIVFVLHAMSKNDTIKKSETIDTLSFGPGLTIEAMGLTKC